MSKGTQRCYIFGPYRLEAQAGVLYRGDEPVPLSPKTVDTLLALVRRSGQVASKDELMRELWPDTFVEEENLNQHIFQLRKALGETESGKPYIETVRKRGFRFSAEVRESPAVADTRKRVPRWPVAAGIVVVVLAGVYLFRNRIFTPLSEPAGRVMLAVLPFENLSGDPEQEYFSDGLTEEMITQLGRLSPEGLGVIARTSAMQYKGSKKGADEVGRELGVDYLLEGSVRREDERVRISAQLIRVSDQTHLWAENYERDLRHILAVQAEVAGNIAKQIRVRLTHEASTRLASVRSLNPGAYEAYLRGLYFYHHRFTVEGFHNAIRYFEQAIKADPSYARAYAGLAAACWESGHPFGDLPPKEAAQSAKAAVAKALELDAGLSEAHHVLGHILWEYDWDWEGAEREFQKALALNPSSSRAHGVYSHYLASMGRVAEAADVIKRAGALDPGNPLVSTNHSKPALYARQYVKAIEMLRRVEEMHPDFGEVHRHLGMSYRGMGLYEKAIAEFRKAVTLSGNSPFYLAVLGNVYGLAGRRPEARGILSQLEQLGKERYVDPAIMAMFYAGSGDNDRTFRWLGEAFEERSTLMAKLAHPDWDPLRADPRFQDLLRRVGLPQANGN